MYSGVRAKTIAGGAGSGNRGSCFPWCCDSGTNMSVSPEDMSTSKTLDVNRYATKKTVAQGMMDIALLTANASQLRYVLSLGKSHEFYSIMLGLIITSLVLQVLVGILFLIIGAIDINDPKNHRVANVLNDFIVVMIFILSTINVIINAFGIEQYNRLPPGKEPTGSPK